MPTDVVTLKANLSAASDAINTLAREYENRDGGPFSEDPGEASMLFDVARLADEAARAVAYLDLQLTEAREAADKYRQSMASVQLKLDAAERSLKKLPQDDERWVKERTRAITAELALCKVYLLLLKLADEVNTAMVAVANGQEPVIWTLKGLIEQVDKLELEVEENQALPF